MYWPLMFRTNHERRMFELRAEWRQLLQSEKGEAELREFHLEKQLAEAQSLIQTLRHEAAHDTTLHDALARWTDMGQAGLIVSIAFGPCGAEQVLLYSVAIMGQNGEDLTPRPAVTRTLVQAILAAEDITKKKGAY